MIAIIWRVLVLAVLPKSNRGGAGSTSAVIAA
jgi:hypothetical protein